MSKQRVLLLSAYDADSHKYWREHLVSAFPQWQWQVLSLPPRYFSWRIRGNGFYWSQAEQACLNQPYDLIVATSMVDLATLRGLVPALTQTPTLLYFHENQFAYPASDQQIKSLEPCLVNLYSALAADLVVFNSRYNLNSFMSGVRKFLRDMPDFIPDEDTLVSKLVSKSSVLPVPIQAADISNQEISANRWGTANNSADSDRFIPKLVWNHRWEYDKGVDRLLVFLQACEDINFEISLSVTGRAFRQVPKEMTEIENKFGHCLVHFGFCESRESYLNILSSSHFVLSTAIHEFQGLAVMEAMALGCLPWVPNRLAYPDYVAAEFCYPSYDKDITQEAQLAAQRLKQLCEPGSNDDKKSIITELASNSSNIAKLAQSWTWNTLGSSYQNAFSDCIAQFQSRQSPIG